MAPDPVDDAAVEAERPEYFRVLAENAGLKTELAEARASLERAQDELISANNIAEAWGQDLERMTDERDEAVARAEAAEAERDALAAKLPDSPQ